MVDFMPVFDRGRDLIDDASIELAGRAARGDSLCEIWWVATTRAAEAFGAVAAVLDAEPRAGAGIRLEALVFGREAVTELGEEVWDSVGEACRAAWAGPGVEFGTIEIGGADVFPLSGPTAVHPVAVAAVPVESRRHAALVVVRPAGTVAFDAGDADGLGRLAAGIGVAADVSLARQGWGRPGRQRITSSAPGRVCRRRSRRGHGSHGRRGRAHR